VKIVPNEVKARNGFCECGCGEQTRIAKLTVTIRHYYKGYPQRFVRGHQPKNLAVLAANSAAKKLSVPHEAQNRNGFCECGCGQPTNIAKSTDQKRKRYAGYPNRFLVGHGNRLHGMSRPTRYVKEWNPDHPNAQPSGWVKQHRRVMSEILGRPLQSIETVHHINGDWTDNRPENLQLRHGHHGTGVVLICNNCGSNDLIATPLAGKVNRDSP
jgi:hypothetical protein